MEWDVGPQGLAVLAAMALAFGAVAELLLAQLLGRHVWHVASLAMFALGLVISEAWFGWATEEELQPNIDGVSFDEVLIGLLLCVAGVIATRFLLRRRAGR